MTEYPDFIDREQGYAELHVHSALSFLDGVSTPASIVEEAVRQGLSAVAITDHDGLYGAVQFAEAVKRHNISAVFGSELTLPRGNVHRGSQSSDPDPQGDHLLVLARGSQGYRNLSAAIAQAYLAAGTQGLPAYDLQELAQQAQGTWQILTGCRKGAVRRALEPSPGVIDIAAARDQVEVLVDLFGKDNVAVEITDHRDPWDAVRCDALAQVAHQVGVRLVATGNVHYARPDDAKLAHVVAAIRANRDLDELDGWLPAHGQAYLSSARQMYQRHRKHPYAVTESVQIAAECSFDLKLVAPQLPPFAVPAGHTEESWLRELVVQCATDRYGPRHDERVPGAWAQLDRELDVICDLKFPGYFLIVYQIMELCRARGILAQGRGSAANSAVCYVLGITAVDAVKHGLLFERFLSREREGAPDIDVDIESERREEVIQDVFARYGRTHAAQVANVISYRPRSAVRDAARALGYAAGQQDAWSKQIERRSLKPSQQDLADRDATATQPDTGMYDIPSDVIDVAEQLVRLPRHLGLHPGGIVLCDRPVIEVCPVQWAAKTDRSVLQWDKEDCADAGLVKFDLLGLGMLTGLRLMFEQIKHHEGVEMTLHTIPQDDPEVYDLLCRADTVGVFQVESRAQMATLPRLQPRTFYDIVVEVALIRPGPIQGGSVHPFLSRRRAQREGKLPPDDELYAHPLLKPSLERTLGVPLFQEQLMRIVVDVAGFSVTEADALRRAIGSKRARERVAELEDRLHVGMIARDIPEATRLDIIAKLQAFADFGFPESHAFSFAYLVYASAWVKTHHPAAFYAGLLAAQPMGFYSPQSLTADARRHHVQVLRPCVQRSGEVATAERTMEGDLAVRLGLSQVHSLTRSDAKHIVKVRDEDGPFVDIADVSRRANLSKKQLENLATADALVALNINRRKALWDAGPAAFERTNTLPGLTENLVAPHLPDMDALAIAVNDVAVTGISPQSFPTEFTRDSLTKDGVVLIKDLRNVEHGRRVAIGGVVTHRQRPMTARGVTFLSIEDESGLLNVVCSAGFWARFRRVVRSQGALVIRGRLERSEGVINLVAEHAQQLSLRIASRSRDFQ